MSIFQKAADAIKSLTTPKWYRDLMSEIQTIILSIIIQAGKDYISQLQHRILEVSKMEITNDKKFSLVFTFGKDLMPKAKDSALRLLIESIVSRLKKNKVI